MSTSRGAHGAHVAARGHDEGMQPPTTPAPEPDDDGLVARLVEPFRAAANGVRRELTDRAVELAEPLLDRAREGRQALDRRIVERERRRHRRDVVRAYKRTGLKLPWRAYVVRARKAYEHLAATIESLPEGPLRDELWTTEPRVWDGLAALAEAAAAGQALQARLSELKPLVPKRPWLQRPDAEPEAVRSSREAVAKLEKAVVEARARLTEQSLALVEVATHALDLTVGGELTPRVDRLVDDLVALEQSLEKVPRKPYRP